MRNLDQLDLDILAHLFRDAGMTNKDLAALVGVAPSTCLERVRKLQQDGVLKGAHCEVDYQALGGHIQAMVSCNWPVTAARSSMRFATPSWPCPR
jgi:DNA-binding Lrp family transcriptional regulator